MRYIYKRFSKYLPGVAAVAILLLMAAGVATYSPKGSHLAPATAQASGTSLDGYAWSDNIGWISFNCDTGGPTANNICATSNYGVAVGTGGVLSGYAWSDNIGWINFGANTCGGTPTMAGGALNGFAQAVANDASWDGCISLSGSSPTYGVTLSGNNLDGYAWGSDTVGWVSFNCDTGGPTANNICATSNYAVTYNGSGSPTCTLSGSPNPVGTGATLNLNYTTTNSPTSGVINNYPGATGGTIASPVVTFLPPGSTWTVPSDWNSASNTIEVIGAGGGGSGGDGTAEGGGGGGGAYSKISNVTLTPNTTVGYAIGTAGAGGAASVSGTAGGDTYLCSNTTNCASISGTSVVVGAKGGSGGIHYQAIVGLNGGPGGPAASGVGTTKFSGGAGHSYNEGGSNGGGGGGGAAGPNGNGNAGGNISAGGSGDAGFGGAGGAENLVGVAGHEWDATHGAGGGGGGGATAGSLPGKVGGLYGAGGGAGGFPSGAGAAGTAGIVVVTYTPNTLSSGATNASGATVTTAASTPGSYTYTMTVSNPAGNNSCSAPVTVQTDVCQNIGGLQSSWSDPNGSISGGTCNCNSGYSLSGTQCIVSSATINTFSGPSRVRSGNTATLTYNITNPSSCSIVGTNGYNSGTLTTASGTTTTSAITGNTQFTLSCTGATKSINVGIDPVFQEQ